MTIRCDSVSWRDLACTVFLVTCQLSLFTLFELLSVTCRARCCQVEKPRIDAGQPASLHSLRDVKTAGQNRADLIECAESMGQSPRRTRRDICDACRDPGRTPRA